MRKSRSGAFFRCSGTRPGAALLWMALSCWLLPAVAADLALGKRIYRQGTGADGRPVAATVQGDVAVDGRQLACAGCHGRSGLGSVEADAVIPPVTGSYLYRAKAVDSVELYGTRTEGPGLRPSYTDQSLARAIREGISPASRTLHRLMPRYALSGEELHALIAYLKTLGKHAAPGVTEREIHFATITAEGNPRDKEEMMLQVLRAFIQDKNAQTRGEEKRANHAPWHKVRKYSAYRKWVLHEWQLRGPPPGWPAQLKKYHREQPVFAIISGMAPGPWRPVHEFCESEEIPCLLPVTQLPVTGSADHYTIYASEGPVLTAKALALHLQRDPVADAGFIDVYPAPDAQDPTPLAAFVKTLSGLTGIPLRHPAAGAGGRILVVPVSSGVPELPPGLMSGKGAARIYFVFFGVPPKAQPARDWPAPAFLVSPFSLPDRHEQALSRLRVWLKAKGIEARHEEVAADAFLAASMTGEVLMHMIDNFSREYFIEKVEHVMNRTLMPSNYKTLSLARGQRFASKGCYIIEASGPGPRPASWIVP